MQHHQGSEAIILRHVDYGEADRIVFFFTAEHGLVKGFARGARNSRKRFGNALESFSQVRILWQESSRGDLMSLRESELVDLRAGLRSDVPALALAAYGCELTELLLGEAQAQPEGFALLRAYLDYLAEQGMSLHARLLFDLRILSLTGYLPHLLHCATCGGGLGRDRVIFSADRGGSLCPQCAGREDVLSVAPMTLGTLARSLKSPITLFAGYRFSDQTLGEGCAILQAALFPHLPRPLKSLPFLERMLLD